MTKHSTNIELGRDLSYFYCQSQLNPDLIRRGGNPRGQKAVPLRSRKPRGHPQRRLMGSRRL